MSGFAPDPRNDHPARDEDFEGQLLHARSKSTMRSNGRKINMFISTGPSAPRFDLLRSYEGLRKKRQQEEAVSPAVSSMSSHGSYYPTAAASPARYALRAKQTIPQLKLLFSVSCVMRPRFLQPGLT